MSRAYREHDGDHVGLVVGEEPEYLGERVHLEVLSQPHAYVVDKNRMGEDGRLAHEPETPAVGEVIDAHGEERDFLEVVGDAAHESEVEYRACAPGVLELLVVVCVLQGLEEVHQRVSVEGLVPDTTADHGEELLFLEERVVDGELPVVAHILVLDLHHLLLLYRVDQLAVDFVFEELPAQPQSPPHDAGPGLWFCEGDPSGWAACAGRFFDLYGRPEAVLWLRGTWRSLRRALLGVQGRDGRVWLGFWV